MSIQLNAVGATATFDTPAAFPFAVIQTKGIATNEEIKLVIEATVDDGNTWFVIPAIHVGKGSHVTEIWTNGQWYVETKAFNAIRVRVTDLRSGSTVSALVDVVPTAPTSTNLMSGDLGVRLPVDLGASTMFDASLQLSTTDVMLRRLAELDNLNADRRDALLLDVSEGWYGGGHYGSEIR